MFLNVYFIIYRLYSLWGGLCIHIQGAFLSQDSKINSSGAFLLYGVFAVLKFVLAAVGGLFVVREIDQQFGKEGRKTSKLVEKVKKNIAGADFHVFFLHIFEFLIVCVLVCITSAFPKPLKKRVHLHQLDLCRP